MKKKTPKVGQTVVIKKKGKPALKFKKGGLHKSTGTPQDKKIPESKVQKALKGGYGPKAKKQAQFAKNVLVGGKKK